MNIQKLLKPKSIAIIGASEKPGIGYGVCINILRYQSRNIPVYFVNPKHDEIFQEKCYRSINDLPQDIDLVAICTSRKTVPSILHDAKLKGCGAAVVFASGYSEVGNEAGCALEEDLVNIANKLDIALMGPNCGGFVNFIDSIFAFAFEGEYKDKRGSVGLISQSGQFCIDMMNAKEIKYSYSISSGNSNAINIEDYLEFLVDDHDTRVVALYLEGIKNPQKFENALRKAAIIRKPIIILKGGRSPQGAANVATHTGSLAGIDEMYDVVFNKFGVIRALDLQDLRSTTMLFSTLQSIPDRANYCAMCMSGGETTICADLGYMHGIKYPALQKETIDKLKVLLPFYATPHNPLDMTVTLSYDAEVFANGITTIVEDQNVDIGIIGFTITDKEPTVPECMMIEGIKLANERLSEKILVIVPFIESSRYMKVADELANIGVPLLAAPQYAFLTLRHLTDFIEYDAQDHDLRLSLPTSESSKKNILSEYESRKLLNKQGLNVYQGFLAQSKKDAIKYANNIGYPIVMKIDSSEILHKTELGCVSIGIMDDHETKNTFDKIVSNAEKHLRNFKYNGVSIQKQFTDGLELMIGIIRDPYFGHMLMAGMGGIWVEILNDFSMYPIPINRNEAEDMLSSLKASKLFDGYRGGKIYDKEAFIDLMIKMSDFGYDNKNTVISVDLNPVFVFEKGKGIALGDALIIINE